MRDNDTVVAIYPVHSQAEAAVKQLQKSGYDIRNLSIVVNGYRIQKRVAGFYTRADRIKDWAIDGVFWGGTIGTLSGAALYFFPGIAGLSLESFQDWIAGALAAAVGIGMLGALAAAVYSTSLPNDSVLKYELVVEADDEFLLVANGPEVETAVAREIIWSTQSTVPLIDSTAPWKRTAAIAQARIRERFEHVEQTSGVDLSATRSHSFPRPQS